MALGVFLSQALDVDGSCQATVNRLVVDRALTQQAPGSVGTGAYCRARQRLPTPMVSRLARHTGEAQAGEVPPQWRWQGRAVKLVDGTTVSMPDTAENQARFPQQASQQARLGFPLARLVAVMAGGSGAVLNDLTP